MIIYLLIFEKTITYLNNKGASALFQWLAVFFYGLSPIISIFSEVTSKDSIFAIFELSFLVETDKYRTGDSGKIPWRLIINAFLAMIFRKNGVYIVVCTLVALLLVKKKNFFKSVLTLCTPIAILYLAYVGPFYSVHHVTPGSIGEMFSVPLQQIARLNKYTPEAISPEYREIMYRVVDEKRWELYIPSISDAVKLGFNEKGFNENKVEFFKMWVDLGLHHPATYINAFLANTVDTWYPYARIDGYRGLFGTDVTTSDFIDYRTAPPGTEKTLFPWLNQKIKKLSISMTATTRPIASLLLTPGWYVFFWITSLFLSILNKEKETIPFHTAMAVSLGTILLGPVGAVRYLLIFYLALPLECLSTSTATATTTV